MSGPGPSLPFEDLVAFLESRTGRPRSTWAAYFYGWSPTELALTVGEIAERCDVTRRTVYRWRDAGTIPLDRAERIADRLGEHVALIWPEWPEVVLATAA